MESDLSFANDVSKFIEYYRFFRNRAFIVLVKINPVIQMLVIQFYLPSHLGGLVFGELFFHCSLNSLRRQEKVYFMFLLHIFSHSREYQ